MKWGKRITNICAALLIYSLSFGPVAKIANLHHWDDPRRSACLIFVIYLPVLEVASNCLPFDAFFQWYMGLWGFKIVLA
jgi:hypothetical protein